MIESKIILHDYSLEITAITANGNIDGAPAVFKAMLGRNGKYSLGRVRGREPGTAPNKKVNNVYCDTLQEVAELLQDNVDGQVGYYVWLSYRENGLSIRNQYAPDSITYHYAKKVEVA